VLIQLRRSATGSVKNLLKPDDLAWLTRAIRSAMKRTLRTILARIRMSMIAIATLVLPVPVAM